ncbi:unnamed protein product [Polarella glacialis]|uniref:40S ribosomal protein S17 n=1 Tax=Polarella glacialis TaxID=89957 RepID=A0A813KAV5_POLGL|nr:unnamed protein product [Polarella glacialis]
MRIHNGGRIAEWPQRVQANPNGAVARRAAAMLGSLACGKKAQLQIAEIGELVGNQARYNRLTTDGRRRAIEIQVMRSRLNRHSSVHKQEAAAELVTQLSSLTEVHKRASASARCRLLRRDIRDLLRQGAQETRADKMGRVRTKTLDFQMNKKITEEVATIPSKRMRNKIAGFTTHLMKRIQRGPVRGISLKLQEEERERRMEYVPDRSEVDIELIQVDPDTRDMLKEMDMDKLPNITTSSLPLGGRR